MLTLNAILIMIPHILYKNDYDKRAAHGRVVETKSSDRNRNWTPVRFPQAVHRPPLLANSVPGNSNWTCSKTPIKYRQIIARCATQMILSPRGPSKRRKPRWEDICKSGRSDDPTSAPGVPYWGLVVSGGRFDFRVIGRGGGGVTRKKMDETNRPGYEKPGVVEVIV